MQLKLFTIPLKNVTGAEVEMNAFLRAHRVLAVNKEFVPDGACFQPQRGGMFIETVSVSTLVP